MHHATGAGKDTCEAFVTVGSVNPPIATCNPFVILPATSSCAAHILAADLLTAINAGTVTVGGLGDAVTTVVQPAALTGTYNLPLGTYAFSLTASNCAGSTSCTSVVTVTDQEPLLVQLYLTLVCA